jgi:hypothetical protein
MRANVSASIETVTDETGVGIIVDLRQYTDLVVLLNEFIDGVSEVLNRDLAASGRHLIVDHKFRYGGDLHVEIRQNSLDDEPF